MPGRHSRTKARSVPFLHPDAVLHPIAGMKDDPVPLAKASSDLRFLVIHPADRDGYQTGVAVLPNNEHAPRRA